MSVLYPTNIGRNKILSGRLSDAHKTCCFFSLSWKDKKQMTQIEGKVYVSRRLGPLLVASSCNLPLPPILWGWPVGVVVCGFVYNSSILCCSFLSPCQVLNNQPQWSCFGPWQHWGWGLWGVNRGFLMASELILWQPACGCAAKSSG